MTEVWRECVAQYGVAGSLIRGIGLALFLIALMAVVCGVPWVLSPEFGS